MLGKKKIKIIFPFPGEDFGHAGETMFNHTRELFNTSKKKSKKKK